MKFFNFNYLVTIGSCLSQLAYNVFTDANNPNVSICGEAYYNKDKSKLRYIFYKALNMIFFFQKDHCRWAYENDILYAQQYLNRDIKTKRR